MQTQNDLLRKKSYNFETRVEELSRKLSFDKDQFENKINTLNMEIQRITYSLRQREQESEGLRSQILQLSEVQIQSKQAQESSNFYRKENERLSMENSNLVQDLDSWRVRYSEISHLEYKVQDLLGRLVLTTAEIESLRTMLSNQQLSSSQFSNLQQSSNLRSSQTQGYTTTTANQYRS